jgi:hypothetical protein
MNEENAGLKLFSMVQDRRHYFWIAATVQNGNDDEWFLWNICNQVTADEPEAHRTGT